MSNLWYRYPVRDDIPVMLIDEAEKPARRWRQAVIDLDDAQAVRLSDPQGMLDAVRGLPGDCRAAYDSARLAEGLPSPEGVSERDVLRDGGVGRVRRCGPVGVPGATGLPDRGESLARSPGTLWCSFGGGVFLLLREHGGDARRVS